MQYYWGIYFRHPEDWTAEERAKIQEIADFGAQFMTEEIRKECPTDEVEIVFPPRSDEFWHAYNLAKEIHSWVSCFGGVIFSKEEEKNAEYRCMVPSYPLEIDGLSSYGFGTSYESACPDCKLQLKRKGPLFVHRKYLRNQPFISLCPGFAVNEWVRQIILENGFTT